MSSLKITPLPAFADNYIWLLEHDGAAICVDPGQSEPVLDYLAQHDLQLTQIWVTHEHHDHTGGVMELRNAFPACRVLGASNIADATQTVAEDSEWIWHGFGVQVWQTEGHTEQHMSYLLEVSGCFHVFCGDTLFSAGCGRVFTKQPELLFHSLQRLNKLPANTMFYPAHEYTAQNLLFAEHIEPDNANIQLAQAVALYRPTLPVTLAHERRVNPFLRTAEASVHERVQELTQQKLTDEQAVFIALRELKDRF